MPSLPRSIVAAATLLATSAVCVHLYADTPLTQADYEKTPPA